MALTVTAAAAAGTSATFPTHAVGDRLVVVAWRDGNNAVPTKPAAAGTVPAWLDIDAPTGTNTCSMRSATFVATATNHTTGAWTNATGVAAIVVSGGPCAVGFHAIAGGTGTNTSAAPDLPDQLDISGNARCISVIGARNVTAWGTVPTGYTALATVNTEMRVLSDTDTTVATAVTQPNTATSGGYQGTQIEFAPIPKLATFTDTFATLDTTTKWDLTGAGSVSGGQFRITVSAAYDGITSKPPPYDLTGSSLVIEFAQAPNVSDGSTVADVYLESSLDTTDTIEMLWEASGGAPGQITARQSLNATPNDASVTYSSANHRWWQISESGGTLTWSTSPTGVAGTFTTLRTLPVGAMDITGVRVGIIATSAGPTPGTAIWDNLNPATAAAPTTGAWFGFMSGRSSASGVGGGGGGVSGEFFTWTGLNSTGKLSFVHNYGQFPQSIENAAPNADYYATEWLPPTGEGGAHTSYGGWVRNRPLQVGPMRGGSMAPRSGDYQLEGCREDIEQMKLGGCDGMFCNIMALNASVNWYDVYDKWRTAANTYYPGFYVVPEIDILTPFTSTEIPALADLLVGYHGLGSTWMVGGTFIVAVFGVEFQPLSFYTSLQSALAARGISSTKFAGAFVDYSSPATYTSVMYGSGAWGFGADPAVTATVSTGKAAATARGEKHIAPIQGQDIRPREGDQWTECLNTQNLVATWQKAISEDSPLVQLVTHQDMTEGHEMCGTAARGLVQYEISAFYTAWWKGGAPPTITQDVMFLSYRNHLSTASIVGPQTFEDDQLFAGAGGSTKRYHIEALVFLTAAATVRIKGTDFSAPAGISVWSIPATSGNVTAQIIRSAVTVVDMAPSVPIRSGNIWQSTWQYFMFSSLRPNIGQFDPTMTTAGASPTYPAAPASSLFPATDLYPSTTLYPAASSLFPATDLYPTTTLYPAS